MRTRIERRAPVRVFFPLSRVQEATDDQGRPWILAEGYTYVNAWCGDGYDLTRAAMEAATADYMRWGAVREMHQPSAVGTAVGSVEIEGETLPLGVTWDDRGAFLRAKVVDPDAIQKVREGVYRGFSVSVRATVMRGEKIVSCDWIENSLVDRPADPDAELALFRSTEQPARDYELVRYWDSDDNWVPGPYTFAARIPELREQDMSDDLVSAFRIFLGSVESIVEATNADAPAQLEQSLVEFTNYVREHVFTESISDTATRVQRALSTLNQQRNAGAAAERTADLVRDLVVAQQDRDTAQRQLDRLRADLEAAQAEIQRLGDRPDPQQPRPALYAPAERSMIQHPLDTPAPTAPDEIAQQIDELIRSLSSEPDEEKRIQGVAKLNVLRMQQRQEITK